MTRLISLVALILFRPITPRQRLPTFTSNRCMRMTNPNGLPYSIEYNTSSCCPEVNDGTLYQRPMTPRKVKRRSTRSKRGTSYRQSYYQNPVTKLMERSMETSSNDSFHHGMYQGQSNPLYSTSRPADALPPGPQLPAYLYRNEGVVSPVYVNDSETVI